MWYSIIKKKIEIQKPCNLFQVCLGEFSKGVQVKLQFKTVPSAVKNIRLCFNKNVLPLLSVSTDSTLCEINQSVIKYFLSVIRSIRLNRILPPDNRFYINRMNHKSSMVRLWLIWLNQTGLSPAGWGIEGGDLF